MLPASCNCRLLLGPPPLPRPSPPLVCRGVLAVTMHQPFNEFVSVPRFLLVTPFTVLAVAPHPTLPGVGVLCWERSLLSLTHLATQVCEGVGERLRGECVLHAPPSLPRVPQPLFSTGPAAESEEEDAEEGDEAARQPQPPPPPQQQQQRRSWAGWLRGEQKPQRPTSASLSLAPPASDSAASGGGLRQVGVGVLASFAPETEDSAAFLRVWRAGRRPVARQGVLLKRKKGGWRERAPLGPLAWKRRVFSLQAREILCEAAQGRGRGSGGGGCALTAITAPRPVRRLCAHRP